MFFLNLSAAEFFVLLGSLGGLIAALYLLDRTKRKKVVSSLRFWTPALRAEEHQSRKRMREPWSLLLQLVSLLVLLLAIAQLQWGTREHRGRDHILLIDTSAWTAERTAKGTLLDEEKSIARRYLAGLPAPDRAMLVRVDGLAVPVTSFTSDRGHTARALDQLASGFSALNLEQALSFSRQAQSWSGEQAGEIVYVGPRMISESGEAAAQIPNLRTILVSARRENCGIRRMAVKRSARDSAGWQASIVVKNYGTAAHPVHVTTQFAGTAFAPRTFALQPGAEATVDYEFVTNTAGRLQATLSGGDDLASDDTAVLELPRSLPANVAVFTSRPEVLKPLFEANHQLSVTFYAPAQYSAKTTAEIVVLDQFTPAQRPRVASLWIAPKRESSPVPVKDVVQDAALTAWHSETALGTGLHAKEMHLPEADVFQTFEGDVQVASVAQGPTVIARPARDGHPQIAVIGFDPLAGELRFEVTTPLLFANLLRWLSPEAFRQVEISAGRVGLASATLNPKENADHIRVEDEAGRAVPFTVREQTLQLFASRPGVVRVTSDSGERVLSLTLPDVAEYEWKPPANVAQGLPPSARWLRTALDLWKWLALLGAVGLFTEWMLYGRQRTLRWRGPVAAQPGVSRAAREREVVSK